LRVQAGREDADDSGNEQESQDGFGDLEFAERPAIHLGHCNLTNKHTANGRAEAPILERSSFESNGAMGCRQSDTSGYNTGQQRLIL
jgi:hypothetical protein